MRQSENRRGDEYGEVAQTGGTWIGITLLLCVIVYLLV